MDSESHTKRKLDEVGWDGLLIDIVDFLSRFRWFRTFIDSALFSRIMAYDALHNPCHSDDGDTFLWKLMCYLFPDCWCCAGIRGMLYGVIITVTLFLIWRVV